MSSKDFLESVFRKQALHVTSSDNKSTNHNFSKRIRPILEEMYGLDPERILEETSSESIFVWLCNANQTTVDQSTTNSKNNSTTTTTANGMIRSIEVGDAATALQLHKVGHATYCRAPPRVEQNLVSSLLKATGMGCGQYDPSGESNLTLGRGEVETFMSTNGHVTDWHYDFQENFTIQLSGVKRWSLMHGTIADPLRGCTPHYESPEAVESQLKSAYLYDRKFVFGKPNPPVTARGEVETVLVKPGDVLYFPAGMWHKVETVEPGVSINVSLMATNYANAISQAIYHYLYRDPRFRQPIINNETTSAPDHLQTLLKDLPGLIQQLCKKDGEGAQDILPPVLQYPPDFHVMEEESEGSSVEEDDDSFSDDYFDDDDDDEEGGNQNQDAAEGNEIGENNSDDEHDESSDDHSTVMDDFDIIDPTYFVGYPSGWNFSLDIGVEVELHKNPLSALHKREEITSFYFKDKGSENHKNVFVLNVNYGNESCESAVRVVFYDNENGTTQRLWELERKNPIETENVPLDVCKVTETNHYLISFLVYHGYMQVKKIS
jgi:hypothetical protein